MAIYNGFDINTVATVKPWGAREEQAIKDIIDTLVGDSIAGAKATSGHVHNKLYYDASNTAVTIDGSGNATFIGTVGVNDLDVTTNIDTATLAVSSTSALDGFVGIGGITPATHALDVRAASDSLNNLGFFENNSPGGTSNGCEIRVSTNDNNAVMRCYGDSHSVYANRSMFGTTAGNTFVSLITDAAERLTIDNNGNVGIGITTPGNKLDIITGATTDSSVHIGEVADEGGYINSYIDHHLSIAGGVELVSNQWTARSTVASMVNLYNGEIQFFTDSGLTDGNTYSPTNRMTISSSGAVNIVGTATINDLDVTTNIDAATMTATGTVGVNDLNVTTNIDTATLVTTSTSNFGGTMRTNNNYINNDGTANVGMRFDASNVPIVINTPNTTGDAVRTVELYDNSTLAQGVGAGVSFYGVYTGTTPTIFAGIKAYKTNAVDNNYSAQLHFQTRLNSATPATKMIIDENGNVGIGATTPGNKLDIITGATTSSGFHLGEADNEGFYITSTSDSEGVFGSGAEYVSGSWYARATSASFIYMGSGAMSFITDTGLTDGNTFTATTRMTLYSDGGLFMAGATGGSQGSGTINATAVYDDGSGPLTDYVFEKHYDENYVIPEDNEPAKTFELRYEICKSLDSFLSFVKGKKCLPAFDNGGERLPIGTGYQKLLETVETLVYHLDSINSRLKILEAA